MRERLGYRVQDGPPAGYKPFVTVRMGVPPERAFEVFVAEWPLSILSKEPPRRVSGDGWEVHFEPVVEGGTRVLFEGSELLVGELERFAETAARG